MILLKTKLNIPPKKQTYLVRQRLIKKLHDGMNVKLTLISAPAGFGKTSLVCHWIEQQQVPIAWYSIDEDDNDPSVFFRYLLTALQLLDKSLQEAFEPFLQGKKMPLWKDIMVQVINQIENLPARIYLVLDDYHLIGSQTINEAMFFLLKNMPSQLHISLIARSTPSFSLASFRVKKEMAEISTVDLKFTEQETAQYCQEVMNLDLSNSQLHELYEHTEGWIIGLQMAGLSLQGRNDLKPLALKFSATNKFVLDYLMEEVLRRQSQEVQDFLLKTSLLKRLCADLCRELTGVEKADDMLNYLERANLFLISLDNEYKCYRYHHLFTELLQRRLESSEPESINLLHRKASFWYGENGYLEEAFHHGFASGDMELAADLLEKYVFDLLATSEWVIARRWLEKVPFEISQQRFLLLLFHALVVFLQQEFEDIDTILANLENAFPEKMQQYPTAKQTFAEYLYVVVRTYCLLNKGLYDQAIQMAQKTFPSIPLENEVTRGLLQGVLAMTYLEKGEVLLAIEPIRYAAKVFSGNNLDYFALSALAFQSDVECLQGRLHESEKILNKAIEEAGWDVTSAMAEFSVRLAHIYYRQNKIEKARECCKKGIEYAKANLAVDSLAPGYQVESFLHEVRGHSKQALSSMQEALFLAHRSKSANLILCCENAMVELALMQSDLDTVAKWAQHRQLKTEEPFSRFIEKECLLLARFYLATQRFQEAAELMRTLRPHSEKRRRLDSVLQIDIVNAAALYALGAKDSALPILERAIDFAGKEGYVRPFADSAPYIAELLLVLRNSQHGPVRSYARKLLKSCGIGQSTPTLGRALDSIHGETLTQRETEILKLIVAGLSNKEIAMHTFVSPNTLKTHIRHIFGKLGVNNRDDAILRSNNLKYL